MTSERARKGAEQEGALYPQLHGGDVDLKYLAAQGWPAHSSRPLVTKPGTMIMGCLGFQPFFASSRPGRGASSDWKTSGKVMPWRAANSVRLKSGMF